jgi:transmembrane sensor
MASPHTKAKHNQQILDEAAEWFVDFREGDLDANGKANFSRWLRRSPEHIEAYLEVAAVWEDVPNVVAKESLDTDALIAQARAEVSVVSLSKSSARNSGRVTILAGTVRSRIADRLVLIAASLVACVGTAGLAWHHWYQGMYATDIGEQRLITLDDGTTVELNARTRLRVNLQPRLRNVALLEGQALFHVAKDSARPFIVQSGTTSVRAVGTQFDVYRKDSGATVVTVVEGRVAVSAIEPASAHPTSSNTAPANSAAYLSAGEQVIVTAQSNTHATAQAADVTAATAWTKREIVFQATSLSDVVEEFNRYNRHQLIIDDPTLRAVRVSGVFSSTEPASLLRFLSEQLQLSVKDQNGKIEISRR